MKFGIREIANVVFRAKTSQQIGGKTFKVGQPVFYIDSAKTSTIEGAATTVYATGGRGNTRLIAWEGQKTLTFSVEDALLSPASFAMLSGAGLFKAKTDSSDMAHFHQTTTAMIDSDDGTIDLRDVLDTRKENNVDVQDKIDETAPIYIMLLDDYGDITGDFVSKSKVTVFSAPTSNPTEEDSKKDGRFITINDTSLKGKTVLIDYYALKKANSISELQIDAENFAGYYYVEADTLFRRQADGKDLPANITFPNVKIQSNFTFTMTSSGDPSTFTFTMDCFPGYTYFDRTKKVLCAIQIVDDTTSKGETQKSVFLHPAGFPIAESEEDSAPDYNESPTS